jgi:hypothetical protein
MKKALISIFIVSMSVSAGLAQQVQKPKQDDKVTAVPAKDAKDANAAAGETAKAALAAHGGDKLKAVKTLVIKGSVDVTMSVSPQVLPGTFATIIAGEKYRLEINSAMQSMKQIYDGRETQSSLPGFSLPPITRVGFPVLSRVGDTGYTVTALPESAKKKAGFRITSPEGYYTDFYVDEKTNLLKGFDSSYEISGRTVTTSAEIDKYKIVDGITIPEKYVQRFDLGQMTIYSAFKAKEIFINSEIPEDYFNLSK